MRDSVTNDYFSFMSDKSGAGSKPAQPDQRVVVQVAQALASVDAPELRHESQMEVIESDLSDTVIQRIFRRPNAG